MINQTSRNHRLSPFLNNCRPHARSMMWDTKQRTAQPIFSPAEATKEHWKRQVGHGDASLCHRSFHHCYTFICHCSHYPCPKRLRKEEENLLNVAQISPVHPSGATSDLSSAACIRNTECRQTKTNQKPCTGPCEHLSKQSYSDETEIQERPIETARDKDVEKHTSTQSNQAINTKYKDIKERLTSGNCFLNTSSIHEIFSPKLQPKCNPTETKLRRGIPNPIIPPRDITIEEPQEGCDDSDCEIIYVGKVNKSRGSRQTAMRANVQGEPSPFEKSKSSSNAALFDKHLECQLSTWNKDQDKTEPLEKLRPLDEHPKASSWVPRQKQFDKALILETEYGDSHQDQSEYTKQKSNDWSAVQRLFCTGLGDATHQVQTNATSEGLENTIGDYMDQRPGDLKLSTSSKFSTEEARDVDNSVLLTPPNQAKDSQLLICSSESSISTDTVCTEDDLADNDWAGYGYDHSDLPRIMAVHTIVKDREEKLRGAKKLSSDEKKEWNRLLTDLSSRSPDGYDEVNQKTSFSKVHFHSKLSGGRGTTDHCYSDPNVIKLSGKRLDTDKT